MDVFTSTADPDVGASPAKVISGHNTGAGDIVSMPRRSEGISRDAVCGSLMERLQDRCKCLFCLFR
jgi:hypothetical protein